MFRGTSSTKVGFEGDIIYYQDSDDLNAVRVKLKEGVPSLNIVDFKRTIYATYECANPVTVSGKSFTKGSWKVTYDLNTGQSFRTVSGDFSNLMPACSSTFNSPLPRTIAGELSIAMLLISALSSPTSTNCPASSTRGEGESDDDPLVNCDEGALMNYVLTDDTGKKHKLALSTSTTKN